MSAGEDLDLDVAVLVPALEGGVGNIEIGTCFLARDIHAVPYDSFTDQNSHETNAPVNILGD